MVIGLLVMLIQDVLPTWIEKVICLIMKPVEMKLMNITNQKI